MAARSQVPVVTVSTTGVPADWQVTGTHLEDGLPVADAVSPDGRTIRLCSPLPGEFNVANTALALVMLVEAGEDADAAAVALAAAGPVPGRMERVGAPDGDGAPLAVVDYAHTPDAVESALAALRGSGRPLVVVLGAGGDRDREKRPLMGAAAAAGADIVVVTDDNPRSEDPAAIRAGVLGGARAAAERSGAIVLEVADRRAAVAEAVARGWGARSGTATGPGGVVLVAGKGHEQGQDVAGTVHPFDDRIVLRAALADAATRRAARELPEESRR
jgi:UDP-N-acetylmuramoyl-L-alanyl-D-glutamate--2,6-diaminopimelate ligase